MIMRSLVLLLVAFSISFADWNIADWRVSFSSVIDKFSKMQTVAEKLETAPVAYYGKLIQRNSKRTFRKCTSHLWDGLTTS